MDKFWLGFGAGLGTAYLLGLWATRHAGSVLVTEAERILRDE